MSTEHRAPPDPGSESSWEGIRRMRAELPPEERRVAYIRELPTDIALYERLRRLAARHERSIRGELRYLLRLAIERAEREEGE